MSDCEVPALSATYAEEFPELTLLWKASDFAQPETIVVDDDLATRFGFDAQWLRSPAGASFLVGDGLAPESKPVAMIYAGHQFGNYSPRLGDGRALLLGEVRDPRNRLAESVGAESVGAESVGADSAGGNDSADHADTNSLGALFDLHLKGSGRTPLARGGDGFARLGPMLREYLMAQAMTALGIPSTGSLAVVATGQRIERDGPVPGAVLARLAKSHIRVGTFEYAARLGEAGLVDRLVAYSLERHFAGCHDDVDIPALRLLRGVIERQASLVAQWMQVGFVHGVMNTDNMAISGETIDYGPCAFLEAYSPAAVFSSIDHGGRYAFGNQPAIAQWDLTRLAETLIGSLDEDVDAAIALATTELDGFVTRYRAAMATGMSAKLGVDDGVTLGDELLALMDTGQADFTGTFRALSATLRGDEQALGWLRNLDGGRDWIERWHAAVNQRADGVEAIATSMDAVNPAYVPRNHLVEEALDAAERGDLAPFMALVEVVRDPFTARPGLERFAAPAPASFTEAYQTFCGT